MKSQISLAKAGKYIVLTIFLIIIQACNNYYKVAPAKEVPSTPAGVVQANPQRFFILRSGANGYYMNNLKLSDDKQSVSCTLDSLTEQHRFHMHLGRGGNMRYKKNQPEEGVINEVHMYIPADTAAVAGKTYTLALNKILKIEVLEKDKGRTRASYALGAFAITAGILVVAAVIIVATKSSCPFVSAYDGNDMALQGEIFGGAIYPQMARNDYLELKMAPSPDKDLQLQISNELKERQYTDLAELMVVTHNKNVQMLVDENGKLYSVSNPVAPVFASVGIRDVLPLLRRQNDDKFYGFDDTLTNTGVNHLMLTFNKPINAKRAKLVLRLKNSYWMDLTYGKMTMGFGSYYNTFIKQQHSKPVADLNKWVKEQELPLHVELNTNSGWKNEADITTFGPLATRETVIPLDLTNVTGNAVNVQLSTGFMFWDIDYAAIDFSDDAPYEVSTLQPAKATDETGKDVTQLLTKADDNYLEQPAPGNAVVIKYKFKPEKDKNKAQTFILHAKGYYEHVRDYEGPLDLTFLQQFKNPDALSAYSMKLYKEALRGNVQQVLAAR